jgi:hypothetical protein
LRLSESRAEAPCFATVTDFPGQELASVSSGFVQTLKLWDACPLFVTVNTIAPARSFDDFESLTETSVGAPTVTEIVVFAVLVRAASEAVPRLDAARIATAATRIARIAARGRRVWKEQAAIAGDTYGRTAAPDFGEA